MDDHDFRPRQKVVNSAMVKYYPEWTNESTTSEYRAVTGPGYDSFESFGDVEFLVGCNWILRPAGLRQFFEQYLKEDQEITWDVANACFRIHCQRDNQAEIMTRISMIMDDILKGGELPSPVDDAENEMVRHPSQSASLSAAQELRDYQEFSFPKEILLFPVRSTWKLPGGRAEDGPSLYQLLAGNDPAKLMTDRTKSTVIQSGDGLTLYFGAHSVDEISKAKQKMDNILRYHGMRYRYGMTQNVIYTEDNSSGLVELRYLAQTHLVHVRSIILDPTRFQLQQAYGKIFEKGCFVRSLRVQGEFLVPDAMQPSPVISRELVERSFEYFKDHRVTEKRQTWLDLAQATDNLIDTIVEPVQQPDHQTSPGVYEWTDLVSQFGSMSLATSSEVSVPTPVTGATEPQEKASEDEQVDLLTSSPLKNKQNVDGVLIPTRTYRQQEQIPRQPVAIRQDLSTDRPRRDATLSRSKTKSPQATTGDVVVAARDRIIDSIPKMLEPLRLYQGSVILKAEIGRIWFTNVNWQHIGIPGLKQHSRARDVASMEAALESHCSARDLYFNNIVTTQGGDANHIANLPGPGGNGRMWVPGSGRTFYEFWCTTKNLSGSKTYFVLEIDAIDFTHEIRKADPGETNIYVHCAKRDFDFRVVIEATPAIKESYEPFAQEVVASLQVGHLSGGNDLPKLSLMYFRQWGIEIKSVRFRQVAIYEHHEGTTKLHITHVHCMKKTTVQKDDIACLIHAYPDLGNPDDGYFPNWFEAYVTSNEIVDAFTENNELEFAQEASWAPDKFKDSGALNDLLDHTTSTLKQMDGVGYWVSNGQDDMRYGRPPHTKQQASQQREASEPGRYW
ncbi:hypothetical protein PFICI_01182 [Pestalotiopsis fici W106-1]|uniref:Uncharacterized protein n=1 Tax=Pestalotiopsis fici (strain W106-1 / CGMCC3.15140) TaxID=1229662 RepID=W3XMZ2_PESFW|nr:uncharacterized protein PFICI_01182 [Pestalotiopsis fici W106-1]ETS87354.1 hypothetical protein PFICI_01182 [Pestalotiopsis fici W106-1]